MMNGAFQRSPTRPPLPRSDCWKLLVEANRRLPGLLGHGHRVQCYAELLALEVGLTRAQRTSLRQAALLHDIGKIFLPSEILHSRQPLTRRGWALIRLHPKIGGTFLERLGFQEEVTSAIHHHHEQWNGSGYPHQRSGTEIPLTSRILAVVDTFDAITTHRPYRPARGYGEARQELARVAGSQLDPNLVESFLGLAGSLDDGT
ncbi:MAG: HD domain-containing protein [Deltaproteobacteria bacterium]|nr:HD domain-containing protein [Deltaproteobacteria bacterium]